MWWIVPWRSIVTSLLRLLRRERLRIALGKWLAEREHGYDLSGTLSGLHSTGGSWGLVMDLASRGDPLLAAVWISRLAHAVVLGAGARLAEL